MKQALLDYNRQDCEALELVANRLVDLHREAPADGKSSQSEVVRTSDMKRENPYQVRTHRVRACRKWKPSTRPPIGIISASGSM